MLINVNHCYPPRLSGALVLQFRLTTLMLILSKRFAHNALSLLVVTALSLMLAFIAMELILRHSSIGEAIAAEKFHFYEFPQHFRDQQNEFGYAAFSRNREVAIYAHGDRAWVEYDVSFTANNVGLVQRSDIDPKKPHVIVVGDSFTQGQGASPWFYDLEKELQGRPLANLGIVGTGVQHWEKAVHWFHQHVAGVETVAMIFIANDFLRPYWFAKSSPHELKFCHGVSCSTIFAKLLDAPPHTLAQQQREILRKQHLTAAKNPDSIRSSITSLFMMTRTGSMLIASHRGSRPAHTENFEANKRSLLALHARHKIAFALHLPEKNEASDGAWSATSLEIKNFLSTMNLPYVDGLERCPLHASDFRKFDAHPNPAGYRKIRECVSALLKNYT